MPLSVTEPTAVTTERLYATGAPVVFYLHSQLNFSIHVDAFCVCRSKTFDQSLLTQIPTDSDPKIERKKPQYNQVGRAKQPLSRIYYSHKCYSVNSIRQRETGVIPADWEPSM